MEIWIKNHKTARSGSFSVLSKVQDLPVILLLNNMRQIRRVCWYYNCKDTKPLYHSFMYSLVSLLSGIYPLHAMHSLLVTLLWESTKVYSYMFLCGSNPGSSLCCHKASYLIWIANICPDLNIQLTCLFRLYCFCFCYRWLRSFGF